MKALGYLLLVVVLALGALAGSFLLASESGEVVVLETRDAQGESHETRVWVVDHGGFQWLRTGNPQSQWLARLRANDVVSVTRNGVTRQYRAEPQEDTTTRATINDLVMEKYGLAERFLRALMLDPEVAVPIRLVPMAS
ncbi:MAG: hypothetical protein R3E86_05385 [Pseudomonadales bacterium]